MKQLLKRMAFSLAIGLTASSATFAMGDDTDGVVNEPSYSQADYLLYKTVRAPLKNSFPRIELRFKNNKSLDAEMAVTMDEQKVGLMFKKELAENAGMLFTYDKKQPLCFWMRNTSIPLTIAFLDDKRKIIDIKDMEPFSEKPVCSRRLAQYAIEANQGWFDNNDIGVGDKVDFVQ